MPIVKTILQWFWVLSFYDFDSGLEEAAKIAEQFSEDAHKLALRGDERFSWRTISFEGMEIAARIRELKNR